MKLRFILLFFLAFAANSYAQENFAEFYKKSKERGHLDLKQQVKINRVGLSQFGQVYSDSLENIYAEAIQDIPQMTKDGILSNGVGKYFTKKELVKRIDVYEIQEYFKYRDSKYYDYSDFFANIEQHLAEAELRMKESLYFQINEDCRTPKGFKKFGNLECFAEKIDLYLEKKDMLDEIRDELVLSATAGN